MKILFRFSAKGSSNQIFANQYNFSAASTGTSVHKVYAKLLTFIPINGKTLIRYQHNHKHKHKWRVMLQQ